ncbi:hypothetical protein PIB30_080847 [Stylosanthes scabra]|uniref:Uncharacterized protein n=1 Tax=Stylosanthes scabra TaxID=79078 RepID=A0ABU6RRE8_9FABA|nr:hypothetical protein [Stylosanthes scabra]
MPLIARFINPKSRQVYRIVSSNTTVKWKTQTLITQAPSSSSLTRTVAVLFCVTAGRRPGSFEDPQHPYFVDVVLGNQGGASTHLLPEMPAATASTPLLLPPCSFSSGSCSHRPHCLHPLPSRPLVGQLMLTCIAQTGRGEQLKDIPNGTFKWLNGFII